MGDTNAPGEASAIAPRGLAGSDDSIPLAIALDCIYQVMTVRFVYPLELLFTATLLALVPYALLRGTVQSPCAPVLAGCSARPLVEPHTTHSFTEETQQGRAHQCRANPRHRTGRSPPRWRSPREGIFEDKVEQGRYGPIFPKTPAGYGFSVLAKIIPGREEVFYKYAKTIEETIAAQPDALAVLQLHYLRWVLFPIKGDTYFMYQGIFDTDFDKYTEDAVKIFSATGLRTVFENLEGFPMDWQTNPAAFIKFARDHQCPSFLEYAEYPYVSATEIKKALKVKAALSTMLDQMQ